MYRVVRVYGSGIVGDGSFTDTETLLSPPPMIRFSGGDELERGGRYDHREMTATEVSLSYTENWLQGEPTAAGTQVFYKLVERNSTTAADTTTWVLSSVPEAQRDEIGWKLKFKRFVIC